MDASEYDRVQHLRDVLGALAAECEDVGLLDLLCQLLVQSNGQ